MKHKSKDLKLRAILYYYKSKNQTQTSKIFGCSPRTLMRWVNKFNNCYSFPKNNKMYLSYKLKQVHSIPNKIKPSIKKIDEYVAKPDLDEIDSFLPYNIINKLSTKQTKFK